MILKQKSQMTGRELCDVEGLIFPIIAKADETQKAQKDAFVELINNDGEQLVKLCYTNDDGSKIEQVNEKYRFQIMQDFPHIMEFVFETPKEAKGSGKPQVQKIAKR